MPLELSEIVRFGKNLIFGTIDIIRTIYGIGIGFSQVPFPAKPILLLRPLSSRGYAWLHSDNGEDTNVVRPQARWTTRNPSMIARISMFVLLAACMAWPSALFAQENSPGAYQMPGAAQMPPGSSQFGAAYPPPLGGGYPPQFGGAYAPSAEGGYPPPVGSGYAPQFGGTYPPPAGIDPYANGVGAGPSVYQQQPLPWERDGYSPFRQFIKEVVPNTYVRLEYLSWDVQNVGPQNVGSRTLLAPTGANNSIPFSLFNTDTFTGANGQIPSADFTFNKTSGVRATWGIPLTFGALEFSGFALQQNHTGILNSVPGFNTLSNFTVPGGTILVVPPTVPAVSFPTGVTTTNIPLSPNRVFSPPATPGNPVISGTNPGDLIAPGTVLSAVSTTAVIVPLFEHGVKGVTGLIYDAGYSAAYNSQIWGTEANMILDIGPTSNGVTVNPLVGFRYMTFDEQFKQVGVTTFDNNLIQNGGTLFTASNPLFAPIGQPVSIRGQARKSIIDSKAYNSLFGLQLGTRAKYDSKWLTLGADPRVSVGLDAYKAQVTTTHLRSLADGVRTTTENKLIFAPVFDLSLYGKLHLTPYFSLFAGYNYTYLFQVSRPLNNIYYNDNGAGAAPGVVVNARSQATHWQGLTVGGEFRFRDLKFR